MSFTHLRFSDMALGAAWQGNLGSTPGGVCQGPVLIENRVLCLNTVVLTSRSLDGDTAPFRLRELVAAHELAHAVGSLHDQHLMDPIVSRHQGQPYFSSKSLREMAAMLNYRGDCLKSSTHGLGYGNGSFSPSH